MIVDLDRIGTNSGNRQTTKEQTKDSAGYSEGQGSKQEEG